jgi:hypothetical protein
MVEVEKKLLETIKDYVLRLNNALGYDFNTVEFAVRDEFLMLLISVIPHRMLTCSLLVRKTLIGW